MKSRNISQIAVLSALLVAVNAFAITPAQVDTLRNTLNAVSVPEMPAKASHLVGEAKSEERADVAQVLVRVGIERKPAIAAALAASIARANPEVAAAAATSAALQQPKQIGPITKATVAAAPKQAGAIVAALSKQSPTRYNLIAVAASEAAPEATKEILAAVAANIALIKPVIENAVASAGSSLSVATVIAETEKFIQSTAAKEKTTADKLLSGTASEVKETAALAPPTVGGPFQPVSPGTSTIGSGNTSVVAPGGGRNYGGP